MADHRIRIGSGEASVMHEQARLIFDAWPGSTPVAVGQTVILDRGSYDMHAVIVSFQGTAQEPKQVCMDRAT